MDDVWVGIIGGVSLFLILAFLRGIGWALSYVGRVVADHLQEGLIEGVQESITGFIRKEVQEAVDGRFQTMEHRISDIHRELQDNGGDSLKDAVRRIESRQEEESEMRQESMTEVWSTLSKHGIERRRDGGT